MTSRKISKTLSLRVRIALLFLMLVVVFYLIFFLFDSAHFLDQTGGLWLLSFMGLSVAAAFLAAGVLKHPLNVIDESLDKRDVEYIIAGAISDGIVLLKGDEVLYANAVGEKILGFIPGSLSSGQSLAALVRRSPDEEVAPNTPMAKGARAVLTAVSRSLPVEFTLAEDGRSLHYLIQARPLAQPGEAQTSETTRAGAISATLLVVAQDVTLVRESQEAKSHFLATLSHEIKTPVTSLTMATRLLKRSGHQITDPSMQTLIDTCAEDVDRLRSLLSDLLSISGFDTLTQKMAVQTVDLGRLIRHSVHSFKPEALEREISLQCEIQLNERKPISVSVDPTKVSWAISNLFTNALRHTPKGGKVDVLVSENDGWAEVRIKDSGPGIESRRISQIFEKFSSFYDIRVARSGGAGVGLAITREIIVAHRGRIWVESELGQGAEFCFTLPLLEDLKKDVVRTEPENGFVKKGIGDGKAARSG